jgi:hypothetical protein
VDVLEIVCIFKHTNILFPQNFSNWDWAQVITKSSHCPFLIIRKTKIMNLFFMIRTKLAPWIRIYIIIKTPTVVNEYHECICLIIPTKRVLYLFWDTEAKIDSFISIWYISYNIFILNVNMWPGIKYNKHHKPNDLTPHWKQVSQITYDENDVLLFMYVPN